jgi:Bacterial dnaA protein helix-turn-helix
MYSPPCETHIHGSVALPVERRTTIRSLAVVVSHCSGSRVSDILGPSHGAVVSKARQILTWLARRYTSHSTTVIATHTGRKNHTTVLHSIARVDLAIREAAIVPPAADTPEAWAAVLWAATWPALGYRNLTKMRP